jgi:hypothetical protein
MRRGQRVSRSLGGCRRRGWSVGVRAGVDRAWAVGSREDRSARCRAAGAFADRRRASSRRRSDRRGGGFHLRTTTDLEVLKSALTLPARPPACCARDTRLGRRHLAPGARDDRVGQSRLRTAPRGGELRLLAPSYPDWQGATVGPLKGGAGSTSSTVSHVGPPGGDGLRQFDEQGDRVAALATACRALVEDDRRRRTRPAAPGADIEPEHVVAGRRRPLCSPPA